MPFLHYTLVLLSVCYREVQVIGLETCFLWFLIIHLDTLLGWLHCMWYASLKLIFQLHTSATEYFWVCRNVQTKYTNHFWVCRYVQTKVQSGGCLLGPVTLPLAFQHIIACKVTLVKPFREAWTKQRKTQHRQQSFTNRESCKHPASAAWRVSVSFIITIVSAYGMHLQKWTRGKIPEQLQISTGCSLISLGLSATL